MDESIIPLLTEFNQTDKEMSQIYHTYIRRCGLSDMAFWILYSVWEYEQAITQKELCESWSWSKQTVNSALKNMEKQGLLELEYMPDNRKNKQIVLTPAGMELARRVVVPLMGAEQNTFASLEKQEREELMRLLRKHKKLLRCELKKITP